MFKDKLIELRKQNEDTQELLAKKLNVSRSLVAKWEQGRSYPNEKDLDNIVELYNVTIEEVMSANELKSVYGIEKRKSKFKSVVIILLSFISVAAISLAIAFGGNKTNISYINEEKSFEEMSLINYSSSTGFSSLVCKKESELLFSNEYGYAIDFLEIERYPFTDKSHLYFINYHIDVTPGMAAYYNDLKNYNEEAILEKIDIKINFDLNKGVSAIFGWPQKMMRMGIYSSRYSPIYLVEDDIKNNGVTINRTKGISPNGISYTYGANIMHLLMDNTLTYQVKKLDTTNNDTILKKWELTNLDEVEKSLTSGLSVHYLLEVNDLNENMEFFNMYNEITIKFSDKNNVYEVKKEVDYKLNFEY